MTDPQDGSPEFPAPPPESPPAPGLEAAPAENAPAAELVPSAAPAGGPRVDEASPTFLFFGVLAAISLVADVASKAWAEVTLSQRNPLEPSISLLEDHLAFTLAYNPGGAWGLFQNHSEYVRRPFFLLVSLLAIAFIINLYGRLLPGQRALKWGLPLVLGGALGNLSDRIIRSNVVDFIDYQADWIEAMNRLVAKAVPGWAVTDHWPTFNVADISICIGVGLMAVDMFTSRRAADAPKSPESGPGLGKPVSPPPGVRAEGELGVRAVPEASEPLKPEA